MPLVSRTGRTSWLQLGVFLCLLAVIVWPRQAMALDLVPLPEGPLGLHARYLTETGTALDLEAATERLKRGEFQPGSRPVLAEGLGARPVWAHLSLNNPGSQALPFRLVAGMTWIDRVDVYLRTPDGALKVWHGGDALVGAQYAVPGLGLVFPLTLPPGRSELLLRAQTPDPLLLPLFLLDDARQQRLERMQHYGYGLLYGYLLALMAYNAVIFIGLRARSHLYYALYLLSFIMVNLGYTGHGHAWLWPGLPELQRYVILSLMVTFGVCGVWFAASFLDIRRRVPGLWRFLRALVLLGAAGMAVLAGLDAHEPAVWFAFGFLAFVTVLVVGLGWWAHQRQLPAAGYFLAAALCGMGGTLATILSVWGGLPMTELTFHAIDAGIMLEATLFALALAARMRHQQRARENAEQLARIDPLTGLLNRRAFDEQARGLVSTAQRGLRPLSVLMLDVDHFKAINDRHGHERGDQVLVAVAERLRQNSRAGDLLARWGGEEFLLLLPETTLAQALALGERIRAEVAERPTRYQQQDIRTSVSLGVAELRAEQGLSTLIQAADAALYQAKNSGRDRVCAAQDVTS